MNTRRRFLQSAFATAAAPRVPLRFAVLSDIQYADKATAGRRDYRQSLGKLRQIVELLTPQPPAFTIHLGDLIDTGADSASAIVPLYNRLPGRRYLVLGNHDFFGPRDKVLRRFHLKRGYYSFRQSGWQFVVLDGMEISVHGGWPEASPQARLGAEMLDRLKQQKAPNANDWNGALGAPQRAWLQASVRQAAQRGERTIVFCHFPTLASACRPDHLLWDHAEVLRILDSEPSVAAYFCGHDHNGGYAVSQGVHHITLPGVVENEITRSLKIVELSMSGLSISAFDGSSRQVLPLRAAS
jgi:3',5'-cyclic AMP phosphodiesterase CpdA